MNWTVSTAFGIFVAGAALALTQLWFRPLDQETFMKAMITLAILLGVIVAWNLLQRERRDSARLRDKSELD